MEQCWNEISKMKLGEYAMYYVLKELDKKENQNIFDLLFYILFSIPTEGFYSMIKSSAETLPLLKEMEEGDIHIYNFRFNKEFVA